MSTYGVAAVIDVHGDESIHQIGGWRTAAVPGPWRRSTAYLRELPQVDTIARWLAGVRTARAAVAEDYDEFGALWVVLAKDERGVRTVHRRYVLNADPGDPGAVAAAVGEFDDGDPRDQDVAGPKAAAAAAALFEVDPAAMLAAESAPAHEGLGVIGGPFPWWGALALP